MVGVDGPLATVASFDWLEKRSGEEAVIARTNSLPKLLTAVRAGLGISALPCVLGEADAELVGRIGPQSGTMLLYLVAYANSAQARTERAGVRFVIATKTPMLRELMGFTKQEKTKGRGGARPPGPPDSAG